MSSIRTTLLVALFLVPCASAQTVRYVWTNSPSPGVPFTNWDTAARSLQEAVDACVAGDTVVATDGVYAAGGRPALGMVLTNRALITNAIAVQSVNGPLVTTLRGQGPVGPGAVRGAFLQNGAVLAGFRLENGHAQNTFDPGDATDARAGGAFAFPDCLVTNCHFVSNTTYDAGGGFLGITATVANCVFVRNSAADAGGARLEGGTLRNCSFYDNVASPGFGGGAYVVDGEVLDCYFETNNGYWGGGLMMEGGHASNLVAVSNMAAAGGGLAAAEAVIEEARLLHNTVMDWGGGAYLEMCWIGNSVISNNDLGWQGTGGTSYGAGIAGTGSQIDHCSILNNRGAGPENRGGGVSCSGPDFFPNQISDCVIRGNSAGDGGGIFVFPDALCILSTSDTNVFDLRENIATNYGGGLCLSTQAALIAFGQLVFAANAAANGGGLAALAGARAAVEEADGYSPIFYDNTATNSGGGLYAADPDTQLLLRDVRVGSGDLKIQGNTAYGSDAYSGGGGIALYGGAALAASNLLVEYNRCPQGRGGGLLLHNSQADLSATPPDDPARDLPGTRFVANIATNANKYGGGLYAFGSRVNVQNAAFLKNEGNRGGGLYLENGTTGRLDNLVVARNSALGAGAGIRVFDSGGTTTVCNVRHATLYANTSNGVATLGPVAVSLTNCIVFSNAGVQISADLPVAYSDVEGGYPGVGNLDAPPFLRAPVNDDYHLTLDSPVADAGIDAGITNDGVFRSRPLDLGFDLGAYEYRPAYDDSDGDGIPDEWEGDHGLDPRDPADGPAHGDDDGVPNDDEYRADTDPLDEADFFHLNDCYYDPVRPWHGILVGFPSSAERQYSLYYTEALSNDCVWTAVPGQIGRLGVGTPFDGLNDTNAPGAATARTYRVTVGPLPE